MDEPYGSTEDRYDDYEPGLYEIRVKGHLDERWAAWFEGLTVTPEENGDTLLTGRVVDQAALHGLLRKVRDLGMPLVSVNCVQPGRADEATDVKIKLGQAAMQAAEKGELPLIDF